jgi:AmiR/NasT family two-component response regulator
VGSASISSKQRKNYTMTVKQQTTILVVEDEGIIAIDIQTNLIRLGYNAPVIVSSGEDAIKQVEQMQPDLVMMDIVLNGTMSGIEAAIEIHRRWQTPIIFLTAYTDGATLEKAKLAEPFGYIAKPFNGTELRVNVEIALHKVKMENERRELTARLQRALDEIKKLSGLVPICASCKNIRNDKGYWQAVESYIEEHSDAQFSHGVCPDCIKRLYPDLLNEKNNRTGPVDSG